MKRALRVFRAIVDIASVLVILAGAAMALSVAFPSTPFGGLGRPFGLRASMLDEELFFELARSGNWVGPQTAPAVLMVYISYSCSHCATFQLVLDSLRLKYPEHLAIVIKHFSHPQSSVPSQSSIPIGAECAGKQGKFWEFHSASLANPDLLNTSDGYQVLGVEAGVPDLEEFRVCVRARAPMENIRAHYREALRLGIDGTPTSFVNGIRIDGALPLADVESVITSQFPPARPLIRR